MSPQPSPRSVEAALRGKQVSEILGDALERYLDEQMGPSRSLDVVQETWGSLTIPREKLDQIMAEDGWLDS